MYRQIAEDLRQKIEYGVIGHGKQLPTELELREQYDASRNTVRDAVKWLITRGLVETRPGQGTFVMEKIDPFVTTLSVPKTGGGRLGLGGGEGVSYTSQVTALSREPNVTEPRVEIQKATAVVADALRLADGAMVVSRHQERLIDGTPWSLQTTFYPMRFVEAGAIRLLQAEDIDEGVVGYLSSQLGIKQVGYSDKILVRAPDDNETTFFKLPDDGRVAVVELRRSGFSETGEPLRLTTTVFPADRNQFVYNIGDVPDEPSGAG
ncbi:MAG TPA: GntR family transcriptional regulator [Streptosporangiaceae bacterium]|nr:GntR family transcriptional regulator [Streptosporangiaceae bacterium]